MEIRFFDEVYKDCFLKIDRYVQDNSPCVEVWNNTDGCLARLTVCIPGGLDYFRRTGGEAFADVNNFPGVLKFIEDYGLGLPTGEYFMNGGFCAYPLVRFDRDAVEKYTA